MNTATKTGINAAKTASKKVVQKTAEAIGDLIRNKIAGKINQKIKRIMNQTEYKKVIYHQKNFDKSLMNQDFFRSCMKMEYQKITSLLGNILDQLPKFITKKWIEVYDQPGNANDRYKPSKLITFKASVLQSDLCDYNNA